MTPQIQVLFTPAEFRLLPEQDLSHTTCVVFDILRATSTIVTALHHGAESVHPVETIEAALKLREADPTILLAGERNGRRILADQTGSVDFDLGNSPREFTADAVAGRRIALTTTNGTMALSACAGAKTVLAGSFLNLKATADALTNNPTKAILLVCAGTREEFSLEDALGAGALLNEFPEAWTADSSDSAAAADALYDSYEANLAQAFASTRNGRRLAAIPELVSDIPFCSRMNAFGQAVTMESAGTLRLSSG